MNPELESEAACIYPYSPTGVICVSIHQGVPLRCWVFSRGFLPFSLTIHSEPPDMVNTLSFCLTPPPTSSGISACFSHWASTTPSHKQPKLTLASQAVNLPILLSYIVLPLYALSLNLGLNAHPLGRFHSSSNPIHSWNCVLCEVYPTEYLNLLE